MKKNQMPNITEAASLPHRSLIPLAGGEAHNRLTEKLQTRDAREVQARIIGMSVVEVIY